MRVALFVPCYVDQLAPRVAHATVAVLERLGVEVEFPLDQACCGQPLVNSGHVDDARPLAARFVEVFRGYDHVVAPSASCVATVRHRYGALGMDDLAGGDIRARTWELCEFLVDVLGVDRLPGSFPYRVGLHPACHGLRELRLGASSERRERRDDKVRRLLGSLDGISFVDPTRPDECCGFGGLFSADEEAVSVSMGEDRIADHRAAGAEVMVSTDASCLMHVAGIAGRAGTPFRFLHVAELLAGGEFVLP